MPGVVVDGNDVLAVYEAVTMAGMETESGYGAYNGVPSALWKSAGWMPNSTAAQKEATVRPVQAPRAEAHRRRLEVSGSFLVMAW